MLDSCCDSSTIDAVVALSDALLLVSVIVAICFFGEYNSFNGDNFVFVLL